MINEGYADGFRICDVAIIISVDFFEFRPVLLANDVDGDFQGFSSDFLFVGHGFYPPGCCD
jgi:hypothetical protein